MLLTQTHTLTHSVTSGGKCAVRRLRVPLMITTLHLNNLHPSSSALTSALSLSLKSLSTPPTLYLHSPSSPLFLHCPSFSFPSFPHKSRFCHRSPQHVWSKCPRRQNTCGCAFGSTGLKNQYLMMMLSELLCVI